MDRRSHQERVAAVVRAAQAAGVEDDTVTWAERVLRSRNDKTLAQKIEDVVRSAGKWAVTGLAENTRRMVTGDGIGVALIAPGRVETPFWDPGGGPPEGGLLTADQIADAIVWAISQPSGVDVNTVIVRPIGQPG
jgi:NAD(P)-dependent dehydrogenase (short-subunit alcohol dehydrogenase family)